MTDEELLAGANALAIALWSKNLDGVGAINRSRAILWSRVVIAAAEATAPAPPSISEVDRMWLAVVGVSS